MPTASTATAPAANARFRVNWTAPAATKVSRRWRTRLTAGSGPCRRWRWPPARSRTRCRRPGDEQRGHGLAARLPERGDVVRERGGDEHENGGVWRHGAQAPEDRPQRSPHETSHRWRCLRRREAPRVRRRKRIQRLADADKPHQPREDGERCREPDDRRHPVPSTWKAIGSLRFNPPTRLAGGYPRGFCPGNPTTGYGRAGRTR